MRLNRLEEEGLAHQLVGPNQLQVVVILLFVFERLAQVVLEDIRCLILLRKKFVFHVVVFELVHKVLVSVLVFVTQATMILSHVDAGQGPICFFRERGLPTPLASIILVTWNLVSRCSGCILSSLRH